jgi:hypothetical protein
MSQEAMSQENVTLVERAIAAINARGVHTPPIVLLAHRLAHRRGSVGVFGGLERR